MLGFAEDLLVFGIYLILLALLFGVAYRIFRHLVFPEKGRAQAAFNEDEAQLIQELHRGLERLSQRVESLETILLDRVPLGGASREERKS